MQAVQYSRHSQDMHDLQIVIVPRPTLSPGQALIRVHCAAINHADVLLFQGVLRTSSWHVDLPFTPGYEFSGVIVALHDKAEEDYKITQGENEGEIKRFAVGDEVFGVNWDDGRPYARGNNMVDRHAGCFAEFLAISVKKLSHKPRGMSHSQAASLALAGSVALQCVEEIGLVSEESRVLIIGGGTLVAQLSTQLAKRKGAYVVCTVRPTERETERNRERENSLPPPVLYEYSNTSPIRSISRQASARTDALTASAAAKETERDREREREKPAASSTLRTVSFSLSRQGSKWTPSDEKHDLEEFVATIPEIDVHAEDLDDDADAKESEREREIPRERRSLSRGISRGLSQYKEFLCTLSEEHALSFDTPPPHNALTQTTETAHTPHTPHTPLTPHTQGEREGDVPHRSLRRFYSFTLPHTTLSDNTPTPTTPATPANTSQPSRTTSASAPSTPPRSTPSRSTPSSRHPLEPDLVLTHSTRALLDTPQCRGFDFILDCLGESHTLTLLKETENMIHIGAAYVSLVNPAAGLVAQAHPPFAYARFYCFRQNTAQQDEIARLVSEQCVCVPVSEQFAFTEEGVREMFRVAAMRMHKGKLVLNIVEEESVRK